MERRSQRRDRLQAAGTWSGEIQGARHYSGEGPRGLSYKLHSFLFSFYWFTLLIHHPDSLRQLTRFVIIWPLPAFHGLTHPALPIPHRTPACHASFHSTHVTNSWSQSFYTSSVSCLNCSLSPFARPTIFYVAASSYFLERCLSYSSFPQNTQARVHKHTHLQSVYVPPVLCLATRSYKRKA